MKRLIHSQRFGMIAEICDRIASDIAAQLNERGYKPSEVIALTLTKRLDIEIELNGATDATIIATYERIVLNDK